MCLVVAGLLARCQYASEVPVTGPLDTIFLGFLYTRNVPEMEKIVETLRTVSNTGIYCSKIVQFT
jgi:hypothetical protein